MKHYRFLILVLLLALSHSVQAQVKFGVRGGVNLSDVSLSSSALKSSNRLGYFIGPTVKVSIPIAGLGVDGSVLYSQMDARLKSTDVSSEQSVKQQTIDLPVNVRYTIGLSKVASVFFYAGPQFSFNVGSKHQGDWEWKNSTKSANLGVGLTVLSHVQVNMNYNYQFDSAGSDIVYGKGKAHQWQLGVGYFF